MNFRFRSIRQRGLANRTQLLVALTLLLGLRCAQSQTVTTTLTVGSFPAAVAVNPTTNKIYVVNQGDNVNPSTVSVIDGANRSLTTATSVTAVKVGVNPTALAINPVTNKIYVANSSDGTVTVIDGLTSSVDATVTVGPNPMALAVNPVTNTIYVANHGDGQTASTATVIHGTNPTNPTSISIGLAPTAVAVNPVTNMVYVTCQCGTSAAQMPVANVIDGATNQIVKTVPVGATPSAVVVNPATNKIYVANAAGNSVTVIDGASSSVDETVSTGFTPLAAAVNPVTNKVYAMNSADNTVTVIDGATPQALPVTVAVGNAPTAIALNAATNQIYVTNSRDNTVTVIDGATNTTNGSPIVTGPANSFPLALAVNPVTNRVYAANQLVATVVVIDGETNNAATVDTGFSPSPTIPNSGIAPNASAVNAVTGKVYVANAAGNVSVIDEATNAVTSVPVGTTPFAVAVNEVTNKIYVANFGSNNVTVIDGATNATATVLAGTNPFWIAVNPVTNKVYVTNQGSNNVTVIDGASNSTLTLNVGTFPGAVAVNPVTDKIYVANSGDATVSVIDGATTRVSATVTTGSINPFALVVNPVTNTIYVASNTASGNLTVIDGATNASNAITASPCLEDQGEGPTGLAINILTNKIYIANPDCGNVTVIDGANNSFSTINLSEPVSVAVDSASNKVYVGTILGGATISDALLVMDGPTNTPSPALIGVGPNSDTGSNAIAVAVDPVTGKIFVTNSDTTKVTIIQEQQTLPVPLVTNIAPDPAGTATTPSFIFNVTSNYQPTAPSVQNVYYQLDTWQGPWQRATGSAPQFAAQLSNVPFGSHVLYALASDGQDATLELANSVIGRIAALPFDIVLQGTSTSLSADTNPIKAGGTVNFTAVVTASNTSVPTGAVTFTNGAVNGTVTFFDGTTALGSATVDANGQATFTTSALSVGSHSISAGYGGANGFATSTSAVLTEVVQAGTSTSLTVDTNPTAAGNTVHFTAVVTASNLLAPTGAVTFFDGSTSLGTASLDAKGTATLTTSALSAGSHSITAGYGGASGFATSTSAALTEVVLPDQVIVTVGQNSQSINAGQAAVYNLGVSAQGPLTQPITFSCSSLPAGATCSFSPTSVTANSSPTPVTLTLATTASTAAQLALPVPTREQRLAYAFAFVLPGVVLLGAGIGRRKRFSGKLLTLCVTGSLVMMLCLLVGCGGGGTIPPPVTNNGTPAGSYTVGITATSGTSQTTVVVTLKVS